MDRFWIKKLRELQDQLKNHLAEKARFDSRPARSSLEDLLIGQKLMRDEERLLRGGARVRHGEARRTGENAAARDHPI